MYEAESLLYLYVSMYHTLITTVRKLPNNIHWYALQPVENEIDALY